MPARISRAVHAMAITTLGLCGALCGAWTGQADAALGADAGSVQADASRLNGNLSQLSFVAYDVTEIDCADGTRIREFLSRDGVVFALTWSGPLQPSLQPLLGHYFDAYLQALAAAPPAGQPRPLRVATPQLVVEAGGHMRSVAGRAYLPALIPAGVSTGELR